jgi:hypothetical protein
VKTYRLVVSYLADPDVKDVHRIRGVEKLFDILRQLRVGDTFQITRIS